MSITERLAARSGESSPDLDSLIAEWLRLERPSGRTDEQVEADNDRVVEIERQMAAIPAATVRHVRAKLEAYALGAFGYAPDFHPLIASALADLEQLAEVEPDGAPVNREGACVLAADLLGSLETLASQIDSLAGAATTLGCKMGAIADPGAHEAAELFHVAQLVLEWLHRDVGEMIDDAGRLRRAVEGGAA